MKPEKYITLSEFKNGNGLSPFIIGTFLNNPKCITIDEEEYFYAYSDNRGSSYVRRNEINCEEYVYEYIKALNKMSKCNNWIKHSASITGMNVRFYILNDSPQDKRMAFDDFVHYVHDLAISISPINKDNTMSDDAKDFIRGYMEPRGSIDTNRPYLTQDFFAANEYDRLKPYILALSMGIPMSYINFNPRELQPQYISGEKKRNPQLRINIFYYVKNFGLISKYKELCFENAYKGKFKRVEPKEDSPITYYDCNAPKDNISSTKFMKMFNFYSLKQNQEQLIERDVKIYRKELGIDKEKEWSRETRDKGLAEVVRAKRGDICAICHTVKTFPRRKDDRQFFHAHHVISFKNGNVDIIYNMVLLCPNCHEMMKKGVGKEEDQIKANISILTEYGDVYNFVRAYFDCSNIDELAKKIVDASG